LELHYFHAFRYTKKARSAIFQTYHHIYICWLLERNIEAG